MKKETSTSQKDFKGPFRSKTVEMIRSVITFATDPDNVSTTDSIPAFADIISRLSSNVDQIDLLTSEASAQIQGQAAQKRAAKRNLINLTLPIMSAAFSFGVESNDEILINAMSTTISKLREMTFAELVGYTQNALDTVTPLLSSLAPYNVTSTDLTNWQTAITALADILANVNNAYKHRKALHSTVQVILVDSMKILVNEADTLATQFSSSSPAYYAEYRNNRKLMPYGHMSTQLRLHVVDQDGNPVTQGECLILANDRSGTFNDQGYCLVDFIPPGTHDFSITIPGHIYNYTNVNFKQGKSLTMHVSVDTSSESTATAVTKTEEAEIPAPSIK